MKKILRARLALRVRSDEFAQKCASELSKLGFRVIKPSPRGISFEGPVELFESTFKSKILNSNDESEFLAEPVIPVELGEGVASVYFPTQPIFFNASGDFE